MTTQQLLEKLSEERGDKTLSLLLSQHFKDDERDFKDIKEKLAKREEIAIINGEHLSHINKNIEELKTILDTHIKAVEPILQEYQDKQATARILKRYGKSIIGVGALVGAWIAIKNFLLK